MRANFLVAVLVALPWAAVAQPAQQPDPNTQALSQEIMECVGSKVSLRAQLVAAQQHEAAAIAAAVAKQKADDAATSPPEAKKP